MLKKVNEWAKFNMMNFGINKCATMVIRPDTPLFQNKRDSTFYLAGEQYGFRNREECISLYTALRIICQRRKFEYMDTYLAFLKLVKIVVI